MPIVKTTGDLPDYECSRFSEGENGLLMQDGKGRNIGFLRYKYVKRVEPSDDDLILEE